MSKTDKNEFFLSIVLKLTLNIKRQFEEEKY
jgi:hypothetical protein